MFLQAALISTKEDRIKPLENITLTLFGATHVGVRVFRSDLSSPIFTSVQVSRSRRGDFSPCLQDAAALKSRKEYFKAAWKEKESNSHLNQ